MSGRSLLVVGCLALSCGGGSGPTAVPDAAAFADAAPPVDVAGASPDATAALDAATDAAAPAGPDAGIDTGAVADLGAPSPPFVPIVPCDRAASYVDGTTSVETNVVAYQPQCLRVRAGSFVTIEASVAHPLEPRPGGSPGNPIPMQNSRATIAFPTAGFYPFQCPEHVDQGMLGVVWVTE